MPSMTESGSPLSGHHRRRTRVLHPAPICRGRNNQKPGKRNAGAALETRSIRSCASAQPALPDRHVSQWSRAGAGMSFALMGDMILCARSS